MNDAVAAAVTRWVGSMPAVYAVLVVFSGYMALATWWGPLHRADPYPFPFLLFLNNAAQLVLCLIILVGQRVLSADAERRAVQTYEHTEAIFRQVADLQAHLDRQDEVLWRSLSLLESNRQPRTERHQVQHPPRAAERVVTRNDRIAAWLTTKLGSIWAFYLAAGSQLLWILLPQAGIQRFDRYPFLFMTFLSTLAQLLFMIVITVGQDVLGRAGDRRSEQTFLDAEAVLRECRRMEQRLAAQDRVIDSLSGYVTGRAVERLAHPCTTPVTESLTGSVSTRRGTAARSDDRVACPFRSPLCGKQSSQGCSQQPCEAPCSATTDVASISHIRAAVESEAENRRA
ncbi:DUF1003 domain-containing protein [Nocardia sp. NEAU-G5]|uniref:DUF1003 domain-containing protein n=1 Tax=Nocardia albiluteola TaxID=2842303 RepID=A0ABS6BC97_9NOCA|nr:DUF1003 domain-containing protein [Nocardia albiluteola]MBU3067748.1 DUF1003 domain-containing protein [Nocardia albiluteola]